MMRINIPNIRDVVREKGGPLIELKLEPKYLIRLRMENQATRWFVLSLHPKANNHTKKNT